MTHRKTLLVADTLDLPEVYVVGHMVALWSWALDNARDGKLPTSRRFIARAAQWAGNADEFVDALCSAGFLDVDGNELAIHDFDEYVGRLIERRAANTQRMRAARAKRQEEEAETRAKHVRNTNSACAGATNQPTQPTNQHTEEESSCDHLKQSFEEAIDYSSSESRVILQVMQNGANAIPPVTKKEVELVMAQLKDNGLGEKCRITKYVQAVVYGNREKPTKNGKPPKTEDLTKPDPNLERIKGVDKQNPAAKPGS